jgi:SAM-dependent methyltransferase
MNMLYRDHAEGESLFAKVLNLYGAQEGAARANINRVEYLRSLIERVVETSPSARVRIANIGCGPAQELLALMNGTPSIGKRLDVALIDQEEQAIKYCERTLGPVASRTGARIQYIRESVRRLLTERQLASVLGQRDLVYSAGLFDYLNPRTFSVLLSALYDAVSKHGSLVVGNVAKDNPSRWFMEYCLDWFLTHRSREELLDYGLKLEPAPRRVDVEAEPLGINLFLSIQR